MFLNQNRTNIELPKLMAGFKKCLAGIWIFYLIELNCHFLCLVTVFRCVPALAACRHTPLVPWIVVVVFVVVVKSKAMRLNKHLFGNISYFWCKNMSILRFWKLVRRQKFSTEDNFLMNILIHRINNFCSILTFSMSF